MKRLIVLLVCGSLLSACSLLRSKPEEDTIHSKSITWLKPSEWPKSGAPAVAGNGQAAQPAQSAQPAQPAQAAQADDGIHSKSIKWLKPSEWPKSAVAGNGVPRADINGMPIEKIQFRAGVSTVTVERMAKLQACTGGVGAGLITEPGPVEVYRMVCGDGRVFMARCELRQCKPM